MLIPAEVERVPVGGDDATPLSRAPDIGSSVSADVEARTGGADVGNTGIVGTLGGADADGVVRLEAAGRSRLALDT